MKIARVFPRKTKATPTDELAFTGIAPLLTMEDIDEVHVSITFTYDIPEGEFMAEQLIAKGFKVKVGGPAYKQPAGEFIPGMYLKKGDVITSRGCHNHCWFCDVPKAQGPLIELPIKDGYNIRDDNFLLNSESHIRAVFDMLKRQKEQPEFTGGVEAKILKPWHVPLFKEVKPKRIYCAYDTPDDYEPLVEAGKMFFDGGFKFSSHTLHCYVLIGYPGDTFEKAKKRLYDTIRAGFVPFAMLYTDKNGNKEKAWKQFQGLWVRPAIIVSRNKHLFKGDTKVD